MLKKGFFKDLAKERKHLQKKISEKIHWSWTETDYDIVKTIKEKIQVLSELYNPTIKDFLIVETDASQTTWADCMRALPNGKEKPSLNEKGEIEESKDLQTIKSIDYSASKILIKDNEK